MTAHDAFGYFGKRFGFEVIGLQGISTESEASVQDVNRLVNLLVQRKIPAIFVESTVPEKGIRALIEGQVPKDTPSRLVGLFIPTPWAIPERGLGPTWA